MKPRSNSTRTFIAVMGLILLVCRAESLAADRGRRGAAMPQDKWVLKGAAERIEKYRKGNDRAKDNRVDEYPPSDNEIHHNFVSSL